MNRARARLRAALGGTDPTTAFPVDRSTAMDELTLVARLRDDVRRDRHGRPGAPAGGRDLRGRALDRGGPRASRRLGGRTTAVPRGYGRPRRGPGAGRRGASPRPPRWPRPGPRHAGPGPAATAPRPSAAPAHARAPAPGPASTAAQLVAYATRAAAAEPRVQPEARRLGLHQDPAGHLVAGGGGMLFGPPDGRAVEQGWVRVDGRQQAAFEHGKLVFSPLLPAGTGGALPGGWPDVSYPYLDSLPSNPAKLKAVIEAGLKAQNYVVGSGNIGVFNAIQALMENVVLPLRLRASLYGVLASDPAVHFDARVTDFAGQAGVAFYARQEGYLSIEIVINPRTYAYMGDRYVAYRARNLPSAVNNGVPSGPYIHVNKGQVTGETAVLESGIVAHAGQLP